MKQPETTACGRRARTGTFVEHDQHGVIPMRTQNRMRTLSKQQSQTERRLVERE
jgi:hypothetical protein